MNSLSLGFLYICGLSWLLVEVCLSASDGNWTPLVLYTIGFTVMFAILGCLPLSDRVVNLSGPIFTLIIGAGIALYGFGAFEAGILGGLIRLLGGGTMITLGVLALGSERKEAH